MDTVLEMIVRSWWLFLLRGAAAILFGLAILMQPHAGLVSIAWIIGFCALAFATSFVMSRLRLRKIAP